MTIKVVGTLNNWRGDIILKNIKKHGGKGVMKAARHLENAIINEYTKNLGSVAVGGLGGNLRKRVIHSSPGEAPYVQTSNLSKSTKTSYNFKGLARSFLVKGRVSTDVKYARTLERGGSYNLPQRYKKYTSIRLINPLKRAPVIAPRPVWIPMFMKHRVSMLVEIRDELKKAMR